jgi:hypothetical protein
MRHRNESLPDMPSENDPLEPDFGTEQQKEIVGASDTQVLGVFSLGVIGLALFGGYKAIMAMGKATNLR